MASSSSYEYSYSSGGTPGGATNSYQVTEFNSGLTPAEITLTSSRLNASSEALESSGAVLAGGVSSYTFSGTSGQAGQGNTVGQIAQDLLQLNGGKFDSVNTYSTTQAYNTGLATTIDASAFSQIEAAILRAANPIEISESEVITVNGQTGIWSNKAEILNWRGVIPITQYLINEDSNPEIIRKRTEQQLVYEQEVAIRYLRPPTPPPPGEIHIKQEKNIVTPPAPPLVIRQQPPRPETPAPLVIREAPPRPPAAVGSKVITISGKRLPPPPRKVVIERLAPLPSKPQSVIIERWLPYNQQKRRVIFQRNTEPDPIVQRPKNIIIQWEPPSVTIKKEFRDLGVIRANPVEYVQRYGASLKSHVELPAFVKEIRPPNGVVLAAEYTAPSVFELEGDVQALNLIDLEREGLSEYRYFVKQITSGGLNAGYTATASSNFNATSSVSGASNINALIAELFASVDKNTDGKISSTEAEKLLLRLNSRLGRRYGEDEARIFFQTLDSNRDGFIDFGEFKSALIKQY